LVRFVVQLRAEERRSLHDFRDSKAVADLNEFAGETITFRACYAARTSRMDRGTVVHDDGGFRAGKRVAAPRYARPRLPRAPASNRIPDWNTAWPCGEILPLLHPQRRAAQVGVQNHAGGVDYRLQRPRKNSFHAAVMSSSSEPAWSATRCNSNHRDARAKIRQYRARNFHEHASVQAAGKARSRGCSSSSSTKNLPQ